MALKPCRECGEIVGSEARSRPKCGIRWPGNPPSLFLGLKAVLTLVPAALVVWGLSWL